MRENSKKNMPDIMEAIFDAGYLIFDLIAGILFFVFSKGNPLFILYGVLTLTLCGGDAFHLVPRIIRAVHGSSERIRKAGNRITGILDHDDCILYYFTVCMEAYLPGAECTGSSGSNDLDLCDHQDRGMLPSSE